MSDDDPHVERTIRTPHAVISFKGTLSQVDEIYRTCNTALLATGRYTIPKPGDNPWQEYTPPPEENLDHLRRRVAHLESLLKQSEAHNAMQDLRHANRILELERNEWRQAFTDQAEIMKSALTSLRDDPIPTLYTHVAISYLAL
jgi:hypothetical protein